jgi:hypothetical protein
MIAQAHKSCEIKYQSMNQIDPRPIALKSADGVILAPDSEVLPNACIGLFTEDDHLLLRSVTSDSLGKFSLGRIPDGNYRIVVALAGFAPANARVNAGSSIHSRTLYVHMIVGGIDASSYINLKH